MSTQEIHLLISQNAYLGVIGAFFAIAVSVAIARTIIRIYTWRRLDIDDYFFFLAFFALIISSGLFFHIFSKIYFTATTPAVIIFLEDPGILSDIKTISTEAYVADAFAWVTIFSVKLSFLFYFRRLIKGIPHLGILWWCTLGLIVPMAITLALGSVIVCPYSQDKFVAHCILGGSTFFYREEIMVYYSAVGDIVTDAMLISIPILLLYKAQFKIKQKINVGIVLCLSIFMIVIGFVRAISARTHGTNDTIWANFWIQIESYVSIIMVCMTAFRVLFTIGNKHSQYKPPPAAAPRYTENSPKTWRERARRWGKSKEKAQVLPEIETGVVMTGLRTWIDANGRTVDDTGRDPWEMAALESVVVRK